jgi:tetratricopeptide (TPR) repeat protein
LTGGDGSLSEKWEIFKIFAETALSQEDYVNAENYWWQAIEEAAKSQSQSLNKVALCQDNLGDLYYKLRRFTDAEAIYNDSLDKKIKALGLDHPEIANTLSKVAHCQSFQNKVKEAEDSLKQCLLIYLIAYGMQHPQTRWTINSLQTVYQSQGKTFNVSEISTWGNVPQAKPPEEQAQSICRTCHRPYKGPQCGYCTQFGLMAMPALPEVEELERLNVVVATRDVRDGSILAMSSVSMGVRMANKNNSFANISDVLGKTAKHLIAQGQVVRKVDVADQ